MVDRLSIQVNLGLLLLDIQTNSHTPPSPGENTHITESLFVTYLQ
jgi:hypothetical protein